jgi:hypothetical protein
MFHAFAKSSNRPSPGERLFWSVEGGTSPDKFRSVLWKIADGSLGRDPGVHPSLGNEVTIGLGVNNQPPCLKNTAVLLKSRLEVEVGIVRRTDAATEMEDIVAACFPPIARSGSGV